MAAAATVASMALLISAATQPLLAWAVFMLVAIAATVAATDTATRSISTTQDIVAEVVALPAVTLIRLWDNLVDGPVFVLYSWFCFSFFVTVDRQVLGGNRGLPIGRHDEGIPKSLYCVLK